MKNKKVRPSPEPRLQLFYGYIIVIVSFIIMLVSFGFYSSFGVFLKPLLTQFDWTRALTSGAFSLSFILSGVLGIIMGSLTDKFGSRMVLTLCGFFLGVGFLLMSQVNSVWQLYLFYGAIIGIGMGGAFVPLASTVARWFVKRRSMMTGIALSGLGAGNFIVPPVVSWLIYTYDWRTSYIIVGALVLVFVVLAAQFLKRDPGQTGQLPDGRNRVEEPASKSGFDGFSLKEAALTRQFWILFAMFFCVGFYLFVITVHIVPHAIDLGISAATAANILATVGGLSIVGRVVLGMVADRIGNRPVYIIGFAMMSAATFLLVPIRTEVWSLYLFAAIFGLASSGPGSLTSPLVAELFGMRSHGIIFGVIDIGFPIGGSLGPFVAAYIFDTMGSYQLSFLVCAAVSASGLILAALLKPTRRPGVKTSF